MSPRPAAVSASALAIALLAGAPAAVAATFEVTANPNLSFSPRNLSIQVGDTVRWTNAGGLHNVLADDGSFRCANGCDGQGGNGSPATNGWSFSLTFNDPGTIAYFCEIHGAPGGIGMAGTVTVEGAASEPGALRFSQGSAGVGEGAGSLTLTVERTGGDDGAVSVAYATSNGSALAGFDYSARSGTLSWADNDGAAKSFTVPILEDGAVEGAETFGAALSNPTGGATLGAPSQVTVTIADNDSPGPGPGPAGALQFASAAVGVAEYDPGATLSVTRTGGSSGAVSVGYATGGGSATAGADYVAQQGTLSWADGDAAAKSFTVAILDDPDVEGDETVSVTLSAPTGGATLGAPNPATVTIADNDVPPPGPCSADATALCFLADRFAVEVEWTRRNGTSGRGQAVPFTDRAGLFYFFNQDNLEMLIKVLVGCPVNGRYWVFYAATTNVGFTVTVTDTEAGQFKRYSNPLGQTAAPITDTAAFATCP